MVLFYLIAAFGCLAHAEDHLTYDQIALTTRSHAVGARSRLEDGRFSVTAGRPTWRHFVSRGAVDLELSEREHELLTALFNLRADFRPAADVGIEMQRQAELGASDTFVSERAAPRAAELVALNERLRARFGGPLILIEAGSFRLASPKLPLPKGAVTLLENAEGFRYRGTEFRVAARPLNVLRVLIDEGPTVGYGRLREVLGIASTSRLFHDWIRTLNDETLRATGAYLIEVDRTGRLVTLAPRELPPPAHARAVSYRGHTLDLGAMEARLWDALALDEREPGAPLAISEPELARVNAGFDRVLGILMQIDRAVFSVSGTHMFGEVRLPSGSRWSRGPRDFLYVGPCRDLL